MAKFTVMFKMPDAGEDAIRQAMEDGVLKTVKDQSTARAVVDKFIEYDEYVYIEMDTVAGTAKVLPRKE